MFDTLEHGHLDNLLYSALHGTAWRYAVEQGNLAEAIADLHQIAGGHNDILARAAGTTVGSWWASPTTKVGHELVVAGMLIMAGDRLDYDELARWAQVGYERASAQRYGAY